MENKNLKFDKVRFWVILILLLVGIGLCIDLSYVYYKNNFLHDLTPSVCTLSATFDCDAVARSKYSISLGVPNSLWGLLVYLVMLMLLFVDRIQAKFKNTIFDVFKNPRSYIATLGLLAFAISMYFAYISFFEMKEKCLFCLITYAINFMLAYAAKHQGFFFGKDIVTTVVDFIAGAKKYFILFIVVLVGFVSGLYYLNDSLIFAPELKKQKEQQEFYSAKRNKYAIKGNILGNKDAKVVINIYSDYNCPFCRVVNIMLHKAAQHEDILVNEVNFPLDTTCNKEIGHTLGGHEQSCLYSQYAIAAKKQGQFWGVANVLFDEFPKDFDDAIIKFKKAGLKIDADKLKADMNSKETLDELQADIKRTVDKHIMATPAFEINGVVYTGAMPYEDLIKEIQLARKRTMN